jgi:REP element-mobilizing transposase RayT
MTPKKIYLPNQCYFVTTNVSNRSWYFGILKNNVYIPNDELCQIIINDLNFYRNKFNFSLHGYVVMPDHLHVILTVSDRGNISEVMRDFKSHGSFEINKILKRKGNFWQEDFYEHCIRNEQDFEEKMNYIHLNPVRANFVNDPADYRYSSYRNYYFNDHSLIRINVIEG